jgi:hypothetical protein
MSHQSGASDVVRFAEEPMRSYFLLLAACMACGCAAQHAGDGDEQSQATITDGAVTLHFGADYAVTQSGPIYAGSRLRVVYDADRMPTCRGEQYGQPAWKVTGLYKVNGGETREFLAAGYVPAEPYPEIVVHEVGDLELWFRNDNRWGCEAWDSDLGKNFHFEIKPSPGAPSWMGNAFSVISRETCGESFCDQDKVPLGNGLRFGTWERERATIAAVYFEVYKQGTTDWDNPDLWKQLDVQLHSRLDGAASFESRYVDIDHRVGNNTRYAFGVRDLDPFAATSAALTDKKQCPSFPMRVSSDGQYVEADLEFYMTVSGAELRPAGQPVYRAVFADYLSKYQVCVTP